MWQATFDLEQYQKDYPSRIIHSGIVTIFEYEPGRYRAVVGIGVSPTDGFYSSLTEARKDIDKALEEDDISLTKPATTPIAEPAD